MSPVGETAVQTAPTIVNPVRLKTGSQKKKKKSIEQVGITHQVVATVVLPSTESIQVMAPILQAAPEGERALQVVPVGVNPVWLR